MTAYVFPPTLLAGGSVTVTVPPISVLNPDGSTAQFNFTPIEPGQVVALAGIILGVPITLVAALSANLKKVTYKNDSGKDLILQAAGRDPLTIGKGASGDGGVDFFGLLGEAVTLNTADGSTGTGFLEINFLG